MPHALRHLIRSLRFAAAAVLATATSFVCTAADTATASPAASAAADLPVRYWQLSTGSRIGYIHIPAPNRPDAPTLVFVHGGPGACEVYAYAFAHSWYERLAARGFNIYLYDQIGSGFSTRLTDPRDYTYERHVADLEAIRRQIGSERLILIGESHGATLSARYLATHPDRVDRVIFVSPGALDPAARKAEIYPHATLQVASDYLAWIGETRGAALQARFRQLDSILRRDVRAAHDFAGDAEMDRWFEAFVRERILANCVHDRTRLRERNFAIPGMGWWASMLTMWDGVSRPSMVRERLAGCPVPALILRGDSDYLPPHITDDYVATFRHAKLIRIPAAGHFIWMDQPDRYRDEIEAFLSAGQPSVTGTVERRYRCIPTGPQS
ncbi:MAG TPA: alpha/beta hydrolase [Opitutaceae bacterium]|nr:alpha/beta hydrolase [Opitutaceae bacterium]